MVVFGPNDTMASLELGSIKTLVIYEELQYRRVTVEHPISKEQKILYLMPDQLENPKHFIDDKGIKLEIKDKDTILIEWIIDNYKNFGAALELVNDTSQEGF